MYGELHSRTLALVRDRPASLTLKQIATDTAIDHNWLKAFAAERITSPGVNKVEALYNYLTKGKLHV